MVFLHCSVRTEKLQKRKLKFFLKIFGKIFYFRKTSFFRAKNATVTTQRSGTDYCWLYCGEISANIYNIFELFITHSFTNFSTVVRCHCRTTLPDSCLRLMVFQSRRSLFNSSNCKTSKSMMCEAPIQMSSNKHTCYTYFSRIKCREVNTEDGGWLS